NPGADQTTFVLTVPAIASPNIVVSNPSTTADYIRIIDTRYNSTSQANSFHPDTLTRLASYGVSSLRGMDWFDINATGTTNTIWAGSTMAGGGGRICVGSRSLSAVLCVAPPGFSTG